MQTPFHTDPLNFEIKVKDDQTRIATNPTTTVVVVPDGETKLFQRRAIKVKPGEAPTFDSVLVGELDGVRVYVRAGQIVLTKQDLNL